MLHCTLAKRATARSIFEGSGGQARKNHRDLDRAEAWRRQRCATPPFLRSDVLSRLVEEKDAGDQLRFPLC